MRRVTIRARGHGNVRALHPKTIELTTDADLTIRGTCIVAVAAELDPGRLAGLEGPVVVSLEAGGVRDQVHGTANPRYDASAGRLVIRRSHHRSADTLVFAADRGSADLDRALVAALADGRAAVRLTVAPDVERVEDVGDGGRTRVVLDVDIAAAQAVAQRMGTVLTGEHVPVTFAGALPRRATDRRRVLAASTHELGVWQVRPQDVAAVVADVGVRLVAVVTDPGTPDERVGHEPTVTRAKSAFVVVRDRATGASEDDRLLAALLDAGVPAKTIQDALVTATGAAKRDAYERVVRSRR